MPEFDLAKLMQDVSKTDTGREQIQYIPYANIIPDESNGYSMGGVEELARSIEIVGLQQPLRVRRLADDSYGIISGHRRHAAIGLLIDQGSKLFDQGVPCIVEAGSESSALRELKLLLGNADNRKLTSADEAQQAERISDCIRKLEDEGFVFPGRHRDWVSRLSGLSRTKLARLDAIRNNMTPSMYQAYKDYEINEASAYELQKLPPTAQDAIAKSINASKSAKFIFSSMAAECVKRSGELMKQRTCKDGNECGHKEARFVQVLRSQHLWSSCDGGCCLNCNQLEECKYPCVKGRDKQKKKKAADKDAKEKANEKAKSEREKANANYKASRQNQAKRVLPLVENLGLTDEDKLHGVHYWQTVSVAEIRKAAAGDFGDGQFYDDHLIPSDTKALEKWADQLGCTLDYLTGRSKTPQPVPESEAEQESSDSDIASPAPIACWHSGMKDLPIDRPLLTWTLANEGEVYRTAIWTGGRFVDTKNRKKELTGLFFSRWIEIPDDGNLYEAPMWLSGNPPRDGRYLCLADMGTEKLIEECCDCQAGQWTAYGKSIEDLFVIKAWWPLPAENALVSLTNLMPQPVPVSDTAPVPRANVPPAIPAWSTGDPKKDGVYWCIIQCGNESKTQLARWYDDAWHFYNMDSTIASPVLKWHPLPEEDEE